MTHPLRVLTAEPWAIRPDYLHFMVALATLDRNGRADRRAAEGEDWFRRDMVALSAGSGARPMDGARYAMTTDAGVAILPILGPIFPRANMITEMSGGVSAALLSNDYRLAQEDSDIGAILFVIDSPGGAITGINALTDQFFVGRDAKPSLAHVTGNCASAAYWLACSAGEIATDKTGMLGSIGVVAAVQKQVQPDADGEITVEIVSSNAPKKRPDPQETEGIDEIRSVIDVVEAQFLEDVARGRGISVNDVKVRFGAGGTKMGRDAVSAGMADRVQSFRDSFEDLALRVSIQRRERVLRRR